MTDSSPPSPLDAVAATSREHKIWTPRVQRPRWRLRWWPSTHSSSSVKHGKRCTTAVKSINSISFPFQCLYFFLWFYFVPRWMWMWLWFCFVPRWMWMWLLWIFYFGFPDESLWLANQIAFFFNFFPIFLVSDGSQLCPITNKSWSKHFYENHLSWLPF